MVTNDRSLPGASPSAGRRERRRFDRGYAMTEAEKFARRERLLRKGRLCEPPFGECLNTAATRELVVVVIDPQSPAADDIRRAAALKWDGPPELAGQLPGWDTWAKLQASEGDDTIPVIACASHAKNWDRRIPWAQVRSVVALPPQERDPTADVPRRPVPVVVSLVVMDVDPTTGEGVPGGRPYEVRCSVDRLARWEADACVRIISRAQLPTTPGPSRATLPTLFALTVEDVGPPVSAPYVVVCRGREERRAVYLDPGVRILSTERIPPAK